MVAERRCLMVFEIGGLIADFAFPHIPFIQRWLDSLPDCTYLIENGFSAGAVLKIHGTTTSGELYDLLDKYLEREEEDG